MVSWESLPEVKWQRHEDYQSPPTSAKVKKSWIWNTTAKLFLKHPALPVDATLNLTIPGESWCVLLHYDSSKHYI
jgi:hypothetical protein